MLSKINAVNPEMYALSMLLDHTMIQIAKLEYTPTLFQTKGHS